MHTRWLMSSASPSSIPSVVDRAGSLRLGLGEPARLPSLRSSPAPRLGDPHAVAVSDARPCCRREASAFSRRASYATTEPLPRTASDAAALDIWGSRSDGRPCGEVAPCFCINLRPSKAACTVGSARSQAFVATEKTPAQPQPHRSALARRCLSQLS